MMKFRSEPKSNRSRGGFSLVELLVVVAVILVVAAVATPNIVNALRTQRLRGTAGDYASLLQRARIRAVEDNRFYGVRPNAPANATLAFVDIYPQNGDGTSGQGAYNAGPPSDPVIPFGSDGTTVAAGGVAHTAALGRVGLAAGGAPRV